MSASEQLELGLRDIYRHRLLREQLLLACAAVAEDRGYAWTAKQLDDIWGPLGSHVSATLLRNCLQGVERNYFRAEWTTWFAEQSTDVADVLAEMAGRGKPKKTAADELRDLKAAMRAELGAVANKLIRKAEAP